MYFEEHNGKSYLIYDGIDDITSINSYEVGQDIHISILTKSIDVNRILTVLKSHVNPLPSIFISGISPYKLALGSGGSFMVAKLFINNAIVEGTKESTGLFKYIEFTKCTIWSMNSLVKYIKLIDSKCDTKIEITRANVIEVINSDMGYPRKIESTSLLLSGTTSAVIRSGKINYIQLRNIASFTSVDVSEIDAEKISITDCNSRYAEIKLNYQGGNTLLTVDNSTINKLVLNSKKRNINLEITNSNINELQLNSHILYIQSDNSVKNTIITDSDNLSDEVKQNMEAFSKLINKQTFTEEDTVNIINLCKQSPQLFANMHGMQLLTNNDIDYNEEDRQHVLIELIEGFPELIRSYFIKLYNILNKIAQGRNALFRYLESKLIITNNYDFLYEMDEESQRDIFSELILTNSTLPVVNINSLYFKLIGTSRNIMKLSDNSEYIGVIDGDNYDIIKRLINIKPLMAYNIFKKLGTGKYGIANQLNDFSLSSILTVVYNQPPDEELFKFIINKYTITNIINESVNNNGPSLVHIMHSAIKYNIMVDEIIDSMFIFNNTRPMAVLLCTPLLRDFLGENNTLDSRLFITRICGGIEPEFINRIYSQKNQQILVSTILADDSSFNKRPDLIESFISKIYNTTEIIQSLDIEIAKLYKRYIPNVAVPLNTTNIVITRMLEIELKKIKKSTLFKKMHRQQKTVYIDTVFEEKGNYNKGTKEYNTCTTIEQYMMEHKIDNISLDALNELESSKLTPIEHNEMQQTLIHSATIMFILQINNKLSLMTINNFSEEKIKKYNNYNGMPRKQSIISIDLLDIEYLESTFESVAIVGELILNPNKIPSNQAIKSATHNIQQKFDNIPSTRLYSDIEYIKNYMEQNKTNIITINELAKIDKQLIKSEEDINIEEAYEEQYKILTNPRNWVLKENRIYLEAQSLNANQQILLMNLKSINMLTELSGKFGITKQTMINGLTTYINHSSHPVSRVFLTVVWVRFNIDEDNKSIWINEVQTDMTKICNWTKTASNIMDKLNDKLSFNALSAFKQYARNHFEEYTVCIPNTKTRKALLGGSPTINTYDNNPKKLKFKLVSITDTVWGRNSSNNNLVYIWNSINEKKKTI